MASDWVHVGGGSGPQGVGGIAEALAVHAALLPVDNGRIVYFAGSEWMEPPAWEAIDNEPFPPADPNYAQGKAQIDHSRVYDCRTQQVSNPGSPDADLFCSGHAFLPDGRLVVAGGTQHFPDPQEGDLHHAHWSGSRTSWTFEPSGQFHAKPGASITAVWHTDKHMDVFTTDSSGAVWTTFWDASTGWVAWSQIQPTTRMQPGTEITALWRDNHIDLLATGADGTVWSTWWEAGMGWQPWFAIHPETKMQPGASVAALWRDGIHLDLFATGADGTVWSTWWEPGSPWQPWFSIHAETKMQAGAVVSAVWDGDKHLDLVATAADGVVWNTTWIPGAGWPAWSSVHAETKMQPGAPVAALVRDTTHVDLFATSADGTVWSTWRENGAWQPWFSIHPETKAKPGAKVTGVWNSDKHVDLFVTGSDGVVRSTSWEPGRDWLAWFSVHAETKVQPGAPVAAVLRDGVHIDLFAVSPDGTVWSAWWEAGPGWVPWFAILASQSWIFAGMMGRDPDQTSAGGPMGGGRWYPTLITLADGRVFALTGHPVIGKYGKDDFDFDKRHNNTQPELFAPTTTSWSLIEKQLGVSQAHDYAVYYPRLFVVPHTGEVFCVQPLYSKTVTSDPASGTLYSPNPADTAPPYSVDVMDKSFFYNVNTQQVTRAFTGPQVIDPMYVDPMFTSQMTSSVLLPLRHEENYRARVLVCDAVRPLVADLGSDQPQWADTAPRALTDPRTGQPPVRFFGTAILLPTGDVVVSGGVSMEMYTEADGVRTVEIYHPASNSWSVGAVASETRGYHSVALLMPDGRVWTAGSEFNNTAVPNLSIELFEPDYYHVTDRTTITSAPASAGYGQNIAVNFTPTSTNTPIAQVVLMRCGSVTHSFDGDQRYVGVPFTQNGSTLTVTTPPDGTIAPPGYYMLWIVDNDGNPCKMSRFIRLG